MSVSLGSSPRASSGEVLDQPLAGIGPLDQVAGDIEDEGEVLEGGDTGAVVVFGVSCFQAAGLIVMGAQRLDPVAEAELADVAAGILFQRLPIGRAVRLGDLGRTMFGDLVKRHRNSAGAGQTPSDGLVVVIGADAGLGLDVADRVVGDVDGGVAATAPQRRGLGPA